MSKLNSGLTEALTEPNPNRHLLELDLVRTFAVMCVYTRHWLGSIGYDGPAAEYTQALGIFGVVLFFVLTAHILSLGIREQPAQTWLAFMVRRCFRIYPLAIATILATLIYESVTPKELAANLLLVQNIAGERSILGPLWTLPLEIQMYCVIPIIVAVMLRSSSKSHVALYIGTLVAGIASVTMKQPALGVIAFLPVFYAGIWACHWKPINKQASPVVLLTILVVLLIAYAFLSKHSQTLAAYPIAIAAAAAIIHGRGMQIPHERIRFLAISASKYSYGIYLIHGFLMEKAIPYEAHRMNPPAYLALTLVLTSLASFIAHHAIEAPMISLGKKIANRLSAAAIALRYKA